MQKIEKITKSKLFLIIIFFTLIKPGVFSECTSLIKIGNIIDIFRILILGYTICVFLVNKLKINKTYLILVYYIIILIPTLIYNGDWFTLLVQMFTTLIWIILFNYNIKYNKDNFFDALEIIFYILIVVNSLTIMIFYPGMYVNSAGYLANYFLGYDNNFIMYILPGITISYLNSYRKYGKLTKRTILLYLISLLAVIKAWIATSIVILILFVILLFLFKMNKYKLFKGIKVFGIVLLSFIILLSVLKSTGIYEYIVVNLLKKDITLSNRTIIWGLYLDYIKLKPIIGYGLEDVNILLGKIGVVHAHNIYINNLYQGGIILFLVFLLLISKFWPSKKNVDLSCYNLMKSCIISFLITFCFKADTVLPMFFMILLISFYIREFCDEKVKINVNF